MNGNEREVKVEECKELEVYMWGYLPGTSPEKSPILSPVPVRLPDSVEGGARSWTDICGGGCGFAMAISDCGKLITWGSTDEEGQSYLTSGKHGETPESFPLPTKAPIVKAAAGWAHCVSVTDTGEVYTWGWKECVPLGKVTLDMIAGGSFQKEIGGKQGPIQTEQVSPKSRGLNVGSGMVSQTENRNTGEEVAKRRKISAAKEELESSASGDDYFTLTPCLVNLGPGVRITSVAAGGRHTLALSDMGQLWGWGYGGEGQLGLGSRIKMVSSPHLIPCIEQNTSGKDAPPAVRQGGLNSQVQHSKATGSYVKEIACGGRHSAVITDAGAVLTFGWGQYGQCGQGSTTDLLRPTCVSSLSDIQVEGVSAGLWHTVCIAADGQVFTFGGNQFGQLGTGAEQAETSPKRLDAAILEGKHAKKVSCGARHSTILTDDGQVLSWGWNKYGQLGLGDTIDRSIPSLVPIDGCIPINIACGWWHTLMITEASILEPK
ncbi:Regulator of chromosome condensation family protein isoform 2 [Hibiscus syriacus]|uniref:Regulator of chromosome condensation family protein isoform 2 n=1 Tax=Hibiscus syriacus TaxID=106335 RepID=A0A6A2ZL30_HIBSY|nr:ultraviolet-B receptor UVR8-like [Hibiscus syriacus]KAE8692443.1 Regulator of chromosome condensation family protein isoform 2 [Hibiscus syriacus]